MRKRRPIPPTNHLRAAIRTIDQVAWKLYDEQLAASGAYIEAVSRGDKREILKLDRAKFTAPGERAVALEGGLAPKERRSPIRSNTARSKFTLSMPEGFWQARHSAETRKLRAHILVGRATYFPEP